MEIVLEIFGPRGPLRNSNEVEIGQDELAQILGRYNVGNEKSDYFTPDDVLPPETNVKISFRIVQKNLARDEVRALVVRDLRSIEVRDVEYRVVRRAAAHLPFEVLAEASLGLELEPGFEF